jgi:putative ABC transport system ATP-binding protein
MSTAACVKNLCKDFDCAGQPLRVLHDITLEIALGELTLLVGPSGCGKTTLISLLSGILSPTEGQIDLMGCSLSSMTDSAKVLFRRERIGFIFQQYNLLPALTACENAALPLLAADLPRDKALGRAKEILEQVGMQGHVEKHPSQLSGGQQQRVAIARALVHNPQLIVCDEPTAALDARTGQAVMQLLREVANDPGRAVLVVTHDERIYHFADRILEMSDGRIIADRCVQAH